MTGSGSPGDIERGSARAPATSTGTLHPVVAIVGPTASGKTALSLSLAERIGGEIISMDSRQVYRGMEIGTAKVAPADRLRVPHHGLDLIDPDQRFSAGEFARRARSWIAGIHRRGAVPILVGGTGFFLRALTHPIFRQPELDPERRKALQGYLEILPSDELQRWLGALDPVSAESLQGRGGRQRLLRALELPLLTGRSLSWWHRNAPPEAPPLRPLVFLLDLPREQSSAAIDRRLGEMVEAGLVEEVRALLELGFGEDDPGMNATGYIELIPAVRGEIPLEEALEQVRRNTRAYARRQRTWFRHQLPEETVRLDAARAPGELVEVMVQRIRGSGFGIQGGAPADPQPSRHPAPWSPEFRIPNPES